MEDAVHVVMARIRSEQRTVERESWVGTAIIRSGDPAIDMIGRERRTTTEIVSRLHCENAPAIQYEDGRGLYFWRGIQVPEQVILAPELLRIKTILGERNAEVRRAMMERYGIDRFVLDAGAKCLSKWNGNELLAIDLPDDPDQRLVALKLRCPSTAAVYIIRVPPDQKTVRGALAWSFGLKNEHEYVLRKET